MHVIIPANTLNETATDLKCEIKKYLENKGIGHQTIEIERLGEKCLLTD